MVYNQNMDKTRQDKIKEIAKLRGNSKVITYLTSDRAPLNTQIADDAVSILQRHIANGEKKDKISLFLYTRGGQMMAPLRIVNLLRSYSTNFEILIPQFAHSAGTLLSLGADTIVMTKLSELSPVDPTMTHPFNPTINQPNPSLPVQPKPISVEDVNSYFLYAKDKIKLRPEDMEKVYSYLINNIHKDNTIHPISLGSVYRGYRMAKMLAERMLKFHTKGLFAGLRISKIVNALTGKIPNHDYPIYRDEAKGLGLKIEYASETLEGEMLNLLKLYTDIFGTDKPFNPVEILGSNNEKEFESKGAFIESEGLSDEFIFRGKIIKENVTPSRVGMNIISAKWETFN